MPRINFGGRAAATADSANQGILPEGQYTVRVTSVDGATTRKGDEMWKIRLVVDDGPHEGRMVFDNLVFSMAAQDHVKSLCQAIGLSTDGELDLAPSHIKGKAVCAMVYTEDYQDNEGLSRSSNKVRFGSYSALKAVPTDADQDLPF